MFLRFILTRSLWNWMFCSKQFLRYSPILEIFYLFALIFTLTNLSLCFCRAELETTTLYFDHTWWIFDIFPSEIWEGFSSRKEAKFIPDWLLHFVRWRAVVNFVILRSRSSNSQQLKDRQHTLKVITLHTTIISYF